MLLADDDTENFMSTTFNLFITVQCPFGCATIKLANLVLNGIVLPSINTSKSVSLNS